MIIKDEDKTGVIELWMKYHYRPQPLGWENEQLVVKKGEWDNYIIVTFAEACRNYCYDETQKVYCLKDETFSTLEGDECMSDETLYEKWFRIITDGYLRYDRDSSNDSDDGLAQRKMYHNIVRKDWLF